MRAAAVFLVFAVCKAPAPAPKPDQDPLAALEQTAVRAAQKGRFVESTGVYRRLAALRPTSPARCGWQNAIVYNTFAAGTKREQVQEIQGLAAVDRMFAASATVPVDDRRACHRVLHDVLSELAFIWNKEMTMGCTAFVWDKWPLLEQVLHEFLADFPDDPRAPEARRALERLYELERK